MITSILYNSPSGHLWNVRTKDSNLNYINNYAFSTITTSKLFGVTNNSNIFISGCQLNNFLSQLYSYNNSRIFISGRKF